MNGHRQRRERNIALVARYQQGALGRELALEFQIAESRVYKILAMCGCPRRKKGCTLGSTAATRPMKRERTTREKVLRLRAAGTKRAEIAHRLNIALTTVDWHVKASKRSYNSERVDLLGERESLPPGVVRHSCPGCGFRAESAQGHVTCQREAAAA
jgi:hypothetical protein